MKRFIAAALAVGAIGAFTSTASASHTSVSWKGQDWGISDNASAVVNVDGSVTLTRDTGTSDASLHLNRVLPLSTTNVGESYINDNGTPWIMYTYEDNGEYRGVDIFIDSEGPPPNPRLQAGSLFGCDGLGYTRYTAPPTTEEVVFAEGCDGVFSSGGVHTIYVGQRTDGTIDYNFDGRWYSSTLLKDNAQPFTWRDVHLRLRGTDGSSATFIDFQHGDNHPSEKNDCKDGGTTAGFKNQGDCVSLFASEGKSR